MMEDETDYQMGGELSSSMKLIRRIKAITSVVSY